MKNEFIKGIIKTIDKNLPAILSGGGIVLGLATAGYAVYAGWKLKKSTDEIKETKAKVKEGVKIVAPVVAGAAASTALLVVANKEYAKRFAAVGAAVAATKIDKAKVEEKVSEITGIGKKDEKKSEKQNIPEVRSDVNCHFRDLETGYEFDTTLTNFWETVTKFNELCENETTDISEFYSELLGDRYNFASAHERLRFGQGCAEFNGASTLFKPQLGGGLDDNMRPIYTIEYHYD